MLQFVLCSIDIFYRSLVSSFVPKRLCYYYYYYVINLRIELSLHDRSPHSISFFFSFFLFVPLICYKKYWRAPARANIKYTLARIVQAVSSSFLSFSLYAVYKFNCLRVYACVRTRKFEVRIFMKSHDFKVGQSARWITNRSVSTVYTISFLFFSP